MPFDSRDVARAGAWLVLVLTLISSVQHVAAMFAAGDRWGGWVPAVAIDGGLLVTTYHLTKRRNIALLAGFWMFLLLSIFANLNHALEAALGMPVRWQAIWALDPWQLAKVGATASPPVLAAMMTEVAVGLSRPDEASEQPAVKVSAPPAQQQIGRQRNRQLPNGPRQHRLAVPKSAKTTAKVPNNRLAQPVVTVGEHVEELEFEEPVVIRVDASPAEITDEELAAVEAIVEHGSPRKAADAGACNGVSHETIRKLAVSARDKAPGWWGQMMEQRAGAKK